MRFGAVFSTILGGVMGSTFGGAIGSSGGGGGGTVVTSSVAGGGAVKSSGSTGAAVWGTGVTITSSVRFTSVGGEKARSQPQAMEMVINAAKCTAMEVRNAGPSDERVTAEPFGLA
jgi:hypothetical protein